MKKLIKSHNYHGLMKAGISRYCKNLIFLNDHLFKKARRIFILRKYANVGSLIRYADANAIDSMLLKNYCVTRHSILYSHFSCVSKMIMEVNSILTKNIALSFTCILNLLNLRGAHKYIHYRKGLNSFQFSPIFHDRRLREIITCFAGIITKYAANCDCALQS